MKFGRNLPRNQVPEWASSYINYKGLKKLIKSASQTDQQQEGGPDLAGRSGTVAPLGNPHSMQVFSIPLTATWRMLIISTTKSTKTSPED
jgi:hypothetical protein